MASTWQSDDWSSSKQGGIDADTWGSSKNDSLNSDNWASSTKGAVDANSGVRQQRMKLWLISGFHLQLLLELMTGSHLFLTMEILTLRRRLMNSQHMKIKVVAASKSLKHHQLVYRLY